MFETKNTTSSYSAETPTAPDYIKSGLETLTSAIFNVGNRNPQQYVPGQSRMQQQASWLGGQLASRYGAPSMGGYGGYGGYGYGQQSGGMFNTPQSGTVGQVPTGGGSGSSGGGLFAGLGLETPQTPDYMGYYNAYPDLQRAYQGLSNSQREHIKRSLGLADAAQLTPEAYAQFHWNGAGESEGRNLPTLGGSSSKMTIPGRSYGAPPVTHTGGGAYRPGGDGNQMVQMGQPATGGYPSPAPSVTHTGGGAYRPGGDGNQMVQMGQPDPGGYAQPVAFGYQAQNPVEMYGDAASAARGVINAGPNQVSSAQTYNPATVAGARVQELPGYAATGSANVNLGPMAQSSAATVGPMSGYNANQAGSANLNQAQGYTADQAASASVGPMSGYNAAQADGATVGPAQGYDASQSRNVQIGQMQGYDAADADNVQLDSAPTIDGTSYNPQMIEAERAFRAAQQAAAGYTPAEMEAQSLLTNLQDYMNPYINDVVDTSLSGFDEDRGRIEAQQAAAAARSGAFGGSRFGVQEGITQGELGRQRADLEAGLRSDAFNTGAGLSADDAGRRQSASATNAAARNAAEQQRLNAEMQRAQMLFTGAQGDQSAANNAARFGAESDFAASQANQNSILTRLLNQGQLERDMSLANQAAANDAAQFGASAANQGLLAQLDTDLSRSLADQASINTARQFGADAANQGRLAQAGYDQQSLLSDQQAANEAARFGADARNTGVLAQAGYDQQAGLANIDASNAARMFGADAGNEFARTQAGLDQQSLLSNQQAANDAARFGADAVNNARLAQAQLDQQTGLANQDAANQGLLSMLDADLTRSLADQSAFNRASEFGATQRGQQFLTQAGLDQDANLATQAALNRGAEFNANTINDLNRFNVSQMDTALDRALRGADSLRNTGSTQEANERAAIGLLSQLGAQERSVAQQQANAELSLLSSIAQLFGGLPFEQVTGVAGGGTQTGRSSPGILDYINSYANYVNANSNAVKAIAGAG